MSVLGNVGAWGSPYEGRDGIGAIGNFSMRLEPYSPQRASLRATRREGPAQGEAPAQIQRTTSSPSPKGKILTETPLEKTALMAILTVTRRDQEFTTFNKVADRLKAEQNWENVVGHQMGRLSEVGLKTLVNVQPLDLRGYDQEVLLVIFTAAKERLNSNDLLTPAEVQQLEQLIVGLNTRVVRVDESEMGVIGGGAVNTVYGVPVQDEETGKTVNRVFKPDCADLELHVLMKEQLFGTATASGIPPGVDAHLPSRAVASAKVDELLYDKDRISVKTEFVILNGRRGILMERAAGESPKIIGEKQEEIDLNSNKTARTFVLGRMNSPKGWTKNDAKFLAAMLNYRKVELRLSEKGIVSLVGTTVEFEHLDPNNPITAEGLIRLQVKDIINGECDRHPENYFIDGDGRVKGIDEDCCFGVNAIPEGIDVRSQPSLMGIIPNNASLMLRMPPVITQDIKNAIDQLHGNQSRLIKELEPFISQDEIKATIVRLNKLHTHINTECKVVDTPGELLLTDARNRMNSNNCYWAREMMVYDKDEKGWNHLREHRT